MALDVETALVVCYRLEKRGDPKTDSVVFYCDPRQFERLTHRQKAILRQFYDKEMGPTDALATTNTGSIRFIRDGYTFTRYDNHEYNCIEEGCQARLNLTVFDKMPRLHIKPHSELRDHNH